MACRSILKHYYVHCRYFNAFFQKCVYGFGFYIGWFVCRDAIGIPSVVAAMIGLSILLLLGVLDWDDCLSEKSAWDTLAWFAVLVGMASQLTNLGVISWMSGCVSKNLQSLSLSWPAAFGVLQASYFFIHYLFAGQIGHVGALYSAFLTMHLAAGVPATLAALALAYNTNLFGALTHYSSGQSAVYYGGTDLLPQIMQAVVKHFCFESRFMNFIFIDNL
jgi:DASS family divalent anion:Na+ symporter